MGKEQKKPPSFNSQNALAELRKLSQTEAEHSDFERYLEEATNEKNDRGAAILIAANLENALDAAIGRHLGRPKNTDDLFGIGGPAGTFELKIRMGYTIGIFEMQTRRNLEMVKGIRNAFAHAQIPLGFDHDVLQRACSFLEIPINIGPDYGNPLNLNPPEADKERVAIQGRSRFIRVCNDTSSNLMWWSLSSRQEMDRAAIRVPVEEDRTFWAIRKPLP